LEEERPGREGEVHGYEKDSFAGEFRELFKRVIYIHG
jgi:hypothetical protein